MKKSFEARVLRDRTVDTRKYRYTVANCHDAARQWLEIRRLPIKELDTTSALTNWKTVKVIR